MTFLVVVRGMLTLITPFIKWWKSPNVTLNVSRLFNMLWDGCHVLWSCSHLQAAVADIHFPVRQSTGIEAAIRRLFLDMYQTVNFSRCVYVAPCTINTVYHEMHHASQITFLIWSRTGSVRGTTGNPGLRDSTRGAIKVKKRVRAIAPQSRTGMPSFFGVKASAYKLFIGTVFTLRGQCGCYNKPSQARPYVHHLSIYLNSSIDSQAYETLCWTLFETRRLFAASFGCLIDKSSTSVDWRNKLQSEPRASIRFLHSNRWLTDAGPFDLVI